MPQQVFIGGDSWGVGEHPTLEHQGLEQYFRESGHTVFNVSFRGAGTRDSIGHLLEVLKLHYEPGGLVFWIQSDPVRNLRPYTNLAQQLKEAGSLKALMQQQLTQDYNQLHMLGRRFDTTVYLIGGLSSVAEHLVSERPRLKTLCTSWVELLVGDMYPDTDWSTFAICNSDYTIKDFGSHPDPKLVDELYEFDQNRRVFKNSVFHPDGSHPNRQGHKILYNYIKERLKL